MNDEAFGFASCYFDSSAISSLSEESGSSCVKLFRATTGGTAVSTLNVLELGATPQSEARRRLLQTASWIGGERVLDEPGELLKKVLAAARDDKAHVDPFSAEAEIVMAVKQPASVDDARSLAFRNRKELLDSRWRGMHERMRESTQENRKGLNASDSLLAESPDEWLRRGRELLKSSLAETMDEFVTGMGFPELRGHAAALVEGSEALRFFLGAIAYGIHRHAVRTEGFSLKPKRSPGWIDLQQAIYMAFSRLFVTGDWRQRDALRVISKCSTRKIEIVDYSEFKDVVTSDERQS